MFVLEKMCNHFLFLHGTCCYFFTWFILYKRVICGVYWRRIAKFKASIIHPGRGDLGSSCGHALRSSGIAFSFSAWKDTVLGRRSVCLYFHTNLRFHKRLSKCAPTMSWLFTYRSNLWWARQELSSVSETSIIGGKTLFHIVFILPTFSDSLWDVL